MLELYQAEWCSGSRRVRQRLTELALYHVPTSSGAAGSRITLRQAVGADTIPALRLENGAVIVGADNILAYLGEYIVESLEAEAHRQRAVIERRRYLEDECDCSQALRRGFRGIRDFQELAKPIFQAEGRQGGERYLMKTQRPISRRTFIAWVGGAGAGFYLFGRLPGTGAPVALAQVPGGTLDPNELPKFVTPLLIPPVMPKADTIVRRGQTVDYYEISMKQFAQQILPAGLPETTVWGYGAVKSASPSGLLLHNAPSLTIEAQVNRPVRVKWINDLTDANGNYLPHLLPVDQTLHWANPPGGVPDRDTRPTFTETPGPYTGPVPIVTHVHGAVGVADDSDGYAEAWYLPAAKNIPPGYARNGTWFHFFAHKAAGSYGVGWPPGSAVFQYPNENRASTIWYHDHALGMTRLNVYAGPAGFYLIRGGPAGDDAVIDSRSSTRAVLPGPAPTASDPFPPNKTYYEIPIAIQDRSFNDDGSLFYPDSREFFDGATADDPGFIPDTDLSPIWNPEFFGNTIMVNGNTWPFHQVEKRRYRLRFLNGCQSRFLILDFNNVPGVEVSQIGNEGGFLAAPVNLTAVNGNRLLIGLAERADLIVDFTNVPVGNYILANVGPDEPFGGGEPDEDFRRRRSRHDRPDHAVPRRAGGRS